MPIKWFKASEGIEFIPRGPVIVHTCPSERPKVLSKLLLKAHKASPERQIVVMFDGQKQRRKSKKKAKSTTKKRKGKK